jgi:hypothetical protein
MSDDHFHHQAVAARHQLCVVKKTGESYRRKLLDNVGDNFAKKNPGKFCVTVFLASLQ